jgi:hypothetical protein
MRLRKHRKNLIEADLRLDEDLEWVDWKWKEYRKIVREDIFEVSMEMWEIYERGRFPERI